MQIFKVRVRVWVKAFMKIQTNEIYTIKYFQIPSFCIFYKKYKNLISHRKYLETKFLPTGIVMPSFLFLVVINLWSSQWQQVLFSDKQANVLKKASNFEYLHLKRSRKGKFQQHFWFYSIYSTKKCQIPSALHDTAFTPLLLRHCFLWSIFQQILCFFLQSVRSINTTFFNLFTSRPHVKICTSF